jgi:citrate synthase
VLWCLLLLLLRGCRYTNTSAVISHISFIDGDKGILRYR